MRNKKDIEDYETATGSYSDYFVKIYDSLNEYKDIKQSDKLLFGFIDYACRLNSKKCNWSNKAFEVNTGLSERQVKDSLDNLEQLGLIKRIKKNSKRIIKIRKDFDRSGTFLMVFTRVTRNKNLTINDKFIYSVIRSLANNPDYDFKCGASNSDIAERANCKSLTTVTNSIKKLEQLSYIKVKISNNKNRKITIINDLWSINK